MLVESAWTYRYPPKLRKVKLCRLEEAPPKVREIALHVGRCKGAGVREQPRTGLASSDRQGRHFARHRRIGVLADHALFDMADNLYRRRYVRHHLDHLVSRLQERCAPTSRAIAGCRVDQLFSWKAIRQRSTLRLVPVRRLTLARGSSQSAHRAQREKPRSPPASARIVRFCGLSFPKKGHVVDGAAVPTAPTEDWLIPWNDAA